MRHYRQLLLSNRAWAQEMVDENPEFFTRQVAGQKPDFLWIGCSDSRVSPESMTMTLPGGLFMHRNMANLVNEDDTNLAAVIQYSIEVLKVSHIIVCGHYGCGGILAAMDDATKGPMEEWLAAPRQICADHKHELESLASEDARADRVVELNVIAQIERLARNESVQEAFRTGQPLALHGWVYNLRDGLISPLVEYDAENERQAGRKVKAKIVEAQAA